MPLPRATYRSTPEDFVVEEIPLYLPNGEGEHLYVTFQKRDLTTPEATRRIAAAFGADARAAGWAGMKDRHAVTTQTISLPFPLARSLDDLPKDQAIDGITILSFARHNNKLKPGHLAGNRFTIALRGMSEEAAREVETRLLDAAKRGVPNTFGPQRFGRDGDNPARTLAWIAGRERGPRDKRDQRMLFSSLQSWLFNQVLDRRVNEGSWSAVLPGDLAKKMDSGGMFLVPMDGPELDDAKARAEAGALSATGPMFGASMRWPEGHPKAIEEEVLHEALGKEHAEHALTSLRKLGEGTRRAFRLAVADLSVEMQPVHDGGPGPASGPSAPKPPGIVIARFVLPKGGYATTVLGAACLLVDASRTGEPLPEEGQDGEAEVV